jgi:K+-transporting ATPase c subunit
MTIVVQAIVSLDEKNSRHGSASVNDPVTNESEFNSRITWFDDNGDETSSPYSWSEVSTELDALAAAEAAIAWLQNRRDAYPDMGDQLDDLYHKGAFSDEMAAKLKAVKDANPKG